MENQKVECEKKHKNFGWIIMLVCGIILLIGGGVMVAVPFILPKEARPDLKYPDLPSKKVDNNIIYSDLTGLPLATEAEKTAPAFCVQTPNGLDGARPQVGMSEAGVVFEAIAEAGITRFAAIYQNPSSAVIGPIRSLRMYYLEWDTPFDCTIVHAGGAPDALAAVGSGRYQDLSEDYAYMYRGNASSRWWNNLFTTSNYLKKFASDYGYDTSEIDGFRRLTPSESAQARIDSTVKERLIITEPAAGNTSEMAPKVTNVAVRFGGFSDFNVNYNYNAENNTYLRSFESGQAHEVYACPAEDLGEVNPEGACELKQLAPAVVVTIKVHEELAAYDHYHEDITTTGSGEAYIFQNGVAIAGTWRKDSAADQLKFYDANGAELALAPGQTFVEAVPEYGSIDF